MNVDTAMEAAMAELGIGAIFPALVGYLSTIISLEHAIAIFSAGAYLAMIAGVLALPETRGKALRE